MKVEYNSVVHVLRQDFMVQREINLSSLICFDLGICDGEFYEFLTMVIERNGRDSNSLDFSIIDEGTATVAEVVGWASRQ